MLSDTPPVNRKAVAPSRVRIIGTPTFGWTDAGSGRWLVSLTWAEVDGRAECIGLNIRSHGPTAYGDGTVDALSGEPSVLSSSKLRRLNIGQVIARQRRGYKRTLQQIIEAQTQADAKDLADLLAFRAPRRGRPRDRGPEHFREVAQVYARAWRSSRAPTKAVAEKWQVSHSQAAKWVSKARTLGFLGPTTAGTAGGVARRGWTELTFNEAELSRRQQMAKAYGVDSDKMTILNLTLDKGEEDERVAQMLEIEPFEVAVAAAALYNGRTLHEQKQILQARRRGHSQGLFEELLEQVRRKIAERGEHHHRRSRP